MSAFNDVARVRCYSEQKAAWEKAAEYEGMDMSAWVRMILDRAMQDYEPVLADSLPDPLQALMQQS